MSDRFGYAPSSSLKRRLFRGVQGALYASGAAALYARHRARRTVAILMYHSVAAGGDERWVLPRNWVPKGCFERQMKFLAKRRNVVSVRQLVDMLGKAKEIPLGTVALTFDDGYLDNVTVVAPILKRYALPATLYLATAYVERGENNWGDRLYVAIRDRRVDSIELDGVGPLSLSTSEGRMAAWQLLSARLRSASATRRRELLEAVIRQASPISRPPRLTMRWNEVRQLVRDYPLFDLGVHTQEHVDLTAMSIDNALAEVSGSLAQFRRELGFETAHFSFPYSRSSKQICQRLAELGLRSAMTSEGITDPAQADPFDLRRLEPHSSNVLVRYWTSGAHPNLSLRLFGRS